MGWWVINADTLAGGRFVVSALAEVTASLKLLDSADAADPGERAWLEAHLPAYRERVADDPVTGLMVRIGLGRGWNADFLTPAPDGEAPFEVEVERVRDAAPDEAVAHLEMSMGGPLPAVLRRKDLPERAARIMEWVWRETVLPYWPRRRRILEADIVARTAQLGQRGWAAAVDSMRPGMRWLGSGRLQINAHDYPPRVLSGARLFFVPVTPGRMWVSWEEPHRYAIVYPCSGTLTGHQQVPQPLGHLLGPARAGVLVLLDTPKSTTQLVALTGQALGSVGRHLKVLMEAGLIQRRRAGRSVLYYRTPAGQVLIDANGQGFPQ